MGENVVQIQSGDSEKQRTSKQNRALHRWFRQVAFDMDAAGHDAREVFTCAIPITEHQVKELMFRPVAEIMYGKESSTELSVKEIQHVVDTLQRLFAEKYGISTPFTGGDL